MGTRIAQRMSAEATRPRQPTRFTRQHDVDPRRSPSWYSSYSCSTGTCGAVGGLLVPELDAVILLVTITADEIQTSNSLPDGLPSEAFSANDDALT